jgi:hypothetical protein
MNAYFNIDAARAAAIDAIGAKTVAKLDAADLIPIIKAELLALAATPNRVVEPAHLTTLLRLGTRWYTVGTDLARAADDTVDAQAREALIAMQLNSNLNIGVELNALNEIVRVWTVE